MAKGRTTQALDIEVWPRWWDHPAIAALRAVGHRTHLWGGGNSPEPDLLLHPAGGWDEALFEQFKRDNGTLYRPYLDARIAWARARKRAAKS